MMFVSQLSLKGPPGPLGLTGRPGPLVSVHQPAEPAISVTKNKYNCISYSVCVYALETVLYINLTKHAECLVIGLQYL